DIAAGAGDFTTLVAAVEAADLVDVLKSDGPFTVFAPTDAAFAALPDGTVENLLKPENKDQLIAVLTQVIASVRKLCSIPLRFQIQIDGCIRFRYLMC
ncbi:MAG: fasciclin domain-containing protein, partial [Rhizobiales bacterium]|nr:fasciclin domain-containing protein [Hyphomicrobiales bacterium]